MIYIDCGIYKKSGLIPPILTVYMAKLRKIGDFYLFLLRKVERLSETASSKLQSPITLYRGKTRYPPHATIVYNARRLTTNLRKAIFFPRNCRTFPRNSRSLPKKRQCSANSDDSPADTPIPNSSICKDFARIQTNTSNGND